MQTLSKLLSKPWFLFAIWILFLALVAVFSLSKVISPQFPYYSSDLGIYPRIVAIFAHFDGIHYLRIAKYGYVDTGIQAFFPVYPLLVSALGRIVSPLAGGIIISSLSLVISILGIRKLFAKENNYVLAFLLMFPTSFFLLTVYTESLFLALSIWFFIFLKEKRWFYASILAGIASGTKVIGICLLLPLAYELINWHRVNKPSLSSLVQTLEYLLLASSGLLAFCIYLLLNFGDPFLFFHIQPLFGASRSGSEIILLPQVIYRYIKMLLTLDIYTFVYFRVVLELITFLGTVYVVLKHFDRIKVPYLLFIIPSLIIPTLTGTLSSVPRYVLVLVPFIFSYIDVISNKHRAYLVISLSLQAFLFTMFALGTFVS